MISRLTRNLVRVFWALAAIAGGALANQVSLWAAVLFIAGCAVGALGSDISARLKSSLAIPLAMITLVAVLGLWWSAWTDYNKPEVPNFNVVFVPEPGTSMSAHIDVQNLGKEDWTIALKRYALPDGTALGTDIRNQIAIHGRSVRVSIPTSQKFIEQVIKKSKRFNFELTVIPMKAPLTPPQKLVYPLEFLDNALSAPVAPTTGIPVQTGMNPDAQGDKDLMDMLARPKGVVIRMMSEKNPDGSENYGCFRTPHNGAWVYVPSRGIFTFMLTQEKMLRVMTVRFEPAREHEIKVMWDQSTSEMGLIVDGKPAVDQKAYPNGGNSWQLTCPQPL